MTSLDEAIANRQAALTEHAAKQFLAGYGIPIPRETLAPHADAAADAATRLGFPVVVKASGASLQHKTEVGGIALNLRSAEEVRQEGRRLAALPGCDGLLVAEMVRGERELACGLTPRPAVRAVRDGRPGRDSHRGAGGRGVPCGPSDPVTMPSRCSRRSVR